MPAMAAASAATSTFHGPLEPVDESVPLCESPPPVDVMFDEGDVPEVETPPVAVEEAGVGTDAVAVVGVAVAVTDGTTVGVDVSVGSVVVVDVLVGPAVGSTVGSSVVVSVGVSVGVCVGS